MEARGGRGGGCFYRLLVVALVMAVAIARLLYVLRRTGRPFRRGDAPPRARTLIILGSGGHTAEMLNLLSVLDKDRFAPRFYVAATTDSMSLRKARVFEESLVQKEDMEAGAIILGSSIIRSFWHDWKVHIVTESPVGSLKIIILGWEIRSGDGARHAHFMKIYRSREVGQSYLTSILTTIIAIGHALWLTIKIRPQVVICNGPGTCIPLCASSFLFKVVGLGWSSIFYVESIARVKKLSLSGFLLYHLHLADQLFVQWPQLQMKYPRAHYVGCLM